MSLSGSASKGFADHSLIIEWSATQSIANNNSTVTAKIYLRSNTAWGGLTAPVFNAGSVTVDGATKSFTAPSQLIAYQKKLLTTKTFTVGHNSDGSKSFNFSTTFNVNVTYHGTYYGNQTASGSATLNKIPRHSSLNALPSFTIPGAVSATIVRQSSSMKHSLSFWVARNSNPTLDNDDHWDWIMTKDNVGTSVSFQLSASQFSTALSHMGTATSWKYKVKLWTNGVSGMSAQRYGWINPPNNAKATTNNFSIKVGSKITGKLSPFNSNSNFSYDLTIPWAGWNKTITGITSSSFSYTLTQSDVNAMLSKIPNAKSGTSTVNVWSKFNGTKFRTQWTGTRFTATVDQGTTQPTIGGTPTATDTNSKTVALTGNNKLVIQKQSIMAVKTPASFAAARGSATLKTIKASLGGVTVSANYNNSGQTLTIKQPNLTTKGNLTLSVTDSRGYTVSKSVSVQGYGYTAPNANYTVARVDSFENETDVALKSSWSPVPIGGVNKNAITQVRFRYRKKGTSAWGSYISLTPSISNTLITAPKYRLNLDNNYQWDMELQVTDKLGTYTKAITVPAGKPILFLDADERSMSIGTLPSGRGRLEIVGGESNFYSKEKGTFPSIQLNNGDIGGMNGIWFSDISDNLGEGLHFVTSTGATAGDPGMSNTDATNKRNYDTIYWRDKRMYWDGTEIFQFNNNSLTRNYPELWSGALPMNGSQAVTPSKALADCMTGWVLVWSDYGSSGVGNFDWVMTPIFKRFDGSGGIRLSIPVWTSALANKYIYCTGTQIKGHADNAKTDNEKNAVLRYVWEF